METFLYDMFELSHYYKWLEELEKMDCPIMREAQMVREELEKELSEKDKELLSCYSFALGRRLDYINHHLNIKIYNFGIQIGMELQKSFVKYKD